MEDVGYLKKVFDESGFLILHNFINQNYVEALKNEADTLYEIAQSNVPWASESNQSCIYEAVPNSRCSTHSQLRTNHVKYTQVRSSWPCKSEVAYLLLYSHIPQFVMSVLGNEIFLYNEQYIIKQPYDELSAFPWHRDSDWCVENLQSGSNQYVSLWIALDDAQKENGCLSIKPKSHLQGNSENTTIDVPLKAGDGILFAHTLLHASGPNRTPHTRRAWMPQFSSSPILQSDNMTPVAMAIPLHLAL